MKEPKFLDMLNVRCLLEIRVVIRVCSWIHEYEVQTIVTIRPDVNMRVYSRSASDHVLAVDLGEFRGEI